MKTLYDKDIREPLFFFLEECYGKVRFFEEKIIGRSRADVVMVTDRALTGIEIKSDADTYARLARQVKDYNVFFDYNYIVIGTSHAQHVFEHIPEEWGIITVELVGGQPDFYILRRPSENPKRSMRLKLSLLWRKELDHIRDGRLKYKYTNKNKVYLSKVLADQIPAEELDYLISQELFERDYTLLEK